MRVFEERAEVRGAITEPGEKPETRTVLFKLTLIADSEKDLERLEEVRLKLEADAKAEGRPVVTENIDARNQKRAAVAHLN
jgi:hypothetical protein